MFTSATPFSSECLKYNRGDASQRHCRHGPDTIDRGSGYTLPLNLPNPLPHKRQVSTVKKRNPEPVESPQLHAVAGLSPACLSAHGTPDNAAHGRNFAWETGQRFELESRGDCGIMVDYASIVENSGGDATRDWDDMSAFSSQHDR